MLTARGDRRAGDDAAASACFDTAGETHSRSVSPRWRSRFATSSYFLNPQLFLPVVLLDGTERIAWDLPDDPRSKAGISYYVLILVMLALTLVAK